MAEVLNLKDAPHVDATGGIRIDRRTRWGNPCRIDYDGTQEQVIDLYRSHLWRQINTDDVTLEVLAALRG